MKKITLNDLAIKYNISCDNSKIEDKRFNEGISPRRIRDYVSKGLLSKPIKEGRNVYYTEQHFEELKNIRDLQIKGLTESYLQKNYTHEDNFKSNASDSLRSILEEKEHDEQNKKIRYGLQSGNSLNSSFEDNKKIMKVVQNQWEINNDLQIIVKDDAKIKNNELEIVLQKIKKILKENYHNN
jgi:DNA-binding transcriptional MerR regulator